MRQGKDGQSLRDFLTAQLENYRTCRDECPPGQREEFEVRIRSCQDRLNQLEAELESDRCDDSIPEQRPVIPSFD